MNLFIDQTICLTDPEVQCVIKKEYGDETLSKMTENQNDCYPGYEYKLYGYYKPPQKTVAERVKNKN